MTNDIGPHGMIPGGDEPIQGWPKDAAARDGAVGRLTGAAAARPRKEDSEASSRAQPVRSAQQQEAKLRQHEGHINWSAAGAARMKPSPEEAWIAAHAAQQGISFEAAVQELADRTWRAWEQEYPEVAEIFKEQQRAAERIGNYPREADFERAQEALTILGAVRASQKPQKRSPVHEPQGEAVMASEEPVAPLEGITTGATESNAVNHPKHYNSDPSGVEAITVLRHRNFNVGNAMKYLWRAGLKDEVTESDAGAAVQDIEKAIWYLRDEVERLKALGRN